jgi:hypothetical protein
MMNNLPEPSLAETRPIGRFRPDTSSVQVYPEGSGKLIASGGVGVGSGVAVKTAEGWIVIVAVGGTAVLVGVGAGVGRREQAPRRLIDSRALTKIRKCFLVIPGIVSLQAEEENNKVEGDYTCRA